MKKTNIVFSGFMAAILFSAGAANAAPARIASQEYVDKKQTETLETVSNTYETKENVQKLTQQVTNLGDKITNAETGLETTVNKITEVVGDDTSGLVKDVADLKTEVGGKLDAATADTTYEKVANKKGAIDSASPTASTDYPTVKAVVDYTAQELADVQFNPADISDGALSGDKITGGTISADKLDTALNTKIDGKQDKNMGVGHESHIVTTDETGTITSVATIEQSQVTGLTDALTGKASTADIPTAVSELTNDSGYLTDDDMTGYAKTTDLDAKQNKNVGIENNGKILTVDADGNITTSATIAQSKVEGLETALAGKLESDDLTGYVTSESLTTTLDDYATTTDLGAKQDKLTATGAANQPVYVNEQGVVTAGNTIPTVTTNITTGITDAAQAGAVADKLAKKEDAANKVKMITGENKSSETLFPTIGAITQWTNTEIQKIRDEGIDIGTDNIGEGAVQTVNLGNGAVTTEKIADDAVTEDKLSNDVVAKIDGKADANDVYTKTETDAKILEVALRRPINTCTGTDLCVLSITPENGLAWVNVTDPVGELPTPTVDLDEGIQQ